MPHGFLLINKPTGITSFGVIARLRKITNIKKIGHAGTLDPFATGLLIVAVGREATREISNYMKLDKTYEATFCLGATTETLDPEKPVERDVRFKPEKITEERIEQILTLFIGHIEQKPPAHSAIKIKGVRAYLLARLGKAPIMPSRTVTINHIGIIQREEQDGLIFVKLTIDCGSGTYIRSLARDIAHTLGTTGYVIELRRTRIGSYDLSKAKTLEEIQDSWKESLFQKIQRLKN